MDKSSGLKECPRCGLRNRRGAYQCDFCGWDFKADSDDWMGQLNDLEKMGREVGTIDMDTSTMSKIELTMKRPADIPVKERRPEPEPVTETALLSAEDQGDVLSQAATETVMEVAPESTVKEETMTVAAVSEVAPIKRSEPSVRSQSRSHEKVVSMSGLLQSPYFVPGGSLGAGVVAYAADMAFVASQGVGTVIGWGIAILASGLMAYGVIRLLPLIRHQSKGPETLLCPVCHEVVTEKDAKCPSCGVRFRTSSAKE